MSTPTEQLPLLMQALDAASALVDNLFSLPYTATVKQLLQCFLFAL